MAGNENSGRKPKSAVVHLINGNPSKLPKEQLEAEVKNPPVPPAAPDMPDWLDDDAKEVWSETVSDLLKIGLITKLDKPVLIQYCQAMSEVKQWSLKIQELNKKMADNSTGSVQTSRTGYKDISVWQKLRNDAERRVNDAGAKLGFSPLARRNLRVETPQQELFPNEPKDIANKYFN